MRNNELLAVIITLSLSAYCCMIVVVGFQTPHCVTRQQQRLGGPLYVFKKQKESNNSKKGRQQTTISNLLPSLSKKAEKKVTTTNGKEKKRRQQKKGSKVKGGFPDFGNLLNKADSNLLQMGTATANKAKQLQKEQEEKEALTRRIFLGTALLGAGIGISNTLQDSSSSSPTTTTTTTKTPQPQQPIVPQQQQQEISSTLKWQVSPVNKRSGVTVFDAEKAGYSIKFITYLSRFLLSFDADCQRWWLTKAKDIPGRATSDQVMEVRLRQFAAFSASVEVGLQTYNGVDGPKRLLQSLLKRYCPTLDQLEAERAAAGLLPFTETAKAKELREISEARRQIALLFGFMQQRQPVDELTKVLAAIDNGSVGYIEVQNGGLGYSPGYGPPLVIFPAPDAGDEYERATGRAVLVPSGRLLRIDLSNRGFGYTKPPQVTVSPPANRDGNPKARAATVKALIYRGGVNKGRIYRIQISDPGVGYEKNEPIRVKIGPPDLPTRDGGVRAEAIAVLEYKVGGIQVVNPGSGYAISKPFNVFVEAPPKTASVNMNDPMMEGVVSPDEPLPIMRPPVRDTVRALAYPISKVDREEGLSDNNNKSYDWSEAQKRQRRKSYLSGAVSVLNAKPPPLPNAVLDQSASAQILPLFPTGIGLEFDVKQKRYKLAAGPSFPEWTQAFASTTPLDPSLGIRGRSPIEREKKLGWDAYLRIMASGAICASGSHLIVTPLDVVKTKIQTDPKTYPDAPTTFQKVWEKGGLPSFFTGWAPTFFGFFIWGGYSYASTEYFRRSLTESGIVSDEVAIVLIAAALGGFTSCFIFSPFESVRIRTVAQPNYATSPLGVVQRMIADEGIGSLFKAVPAFWLKEIPFAMAKFTVFDTSTRFLYGAFPAAREDITLSLLISLAGGTLGGLAAAVVSNPADATVSEMKKVESDIGPLEAAQNLVEQDGIGALFRGLLLRMGLYTIVVSFQFLVYDSVRIALGVGTDDLKLYLNVLGGALQETGGPL